MSEEIDSEQALVEGLRRGDPDAHRQLLDQYGESLVRFLMKTCQIDQAEAEDVAIETLYRGIEKIDTFGKKPGTSQHPFRNWLFTIGRNRWRDRARRHGKSVSLIENLDSLRVEQPAIEIEEVSPSIQAVQEALKLLPDSQRQTLALCYDGLQLKEVAELLNVPPGTVRQWKKRGLATLTETLKDHPALAHLVKEKIRQGGSE